MKLEEAITFAIMSDGHEKTTDQIAVAINRNGWHIRKDVMPEFGRNVISRGLLNC